MRHDEKVSWHRRVREANEAQERRAKQLADAVSTQEFGTHGGPTATRSREADAWVAHGAEQLAATLPRHDHVVLIAATHTGSMKTGAASAIKCDSMTALLALGRLVAEVNNALLRDRVHVRAELRMRTIKPNLGGIDDTY